MLIIALNPVISSIFFMVSEINLVMSSLEADKTLKSINSISNVKLKFLTSQVAFIFIFRSRSKVGIVLDNLQS